MQNIYILLNKYYYLQSEILYFFENYILKTKTLYMMVYIICVQKNILL